jgi:hypothetical protein
MNPFLPECHSLGGNSAYPVRVESPSQVPSSIRTSLYYMRSFLIIAFGLVFTSLTTSGQECTLPSRIFLPEADLARYDGYGLDVDVDNNYMVAGAPSNDSLQVDAGRAYVYKLGADNKWIKEDLYSVGHRIALSGQHLIVACPPAHMTSGYGDEMIADYYSSSGAWEDASLQYNQMIREVSVNASDDLFGAGMAARNNFLAVTASKDDEMGVNAGVVYIYDIASGDDEPLQKIYAPEIENDTGFGNSLALGDSVMFIAAPFKDSISADQTRKFSGIGQVYVYRLASDGWKYHSQIVAPNIHSETYFGQNVVCSPGYVAVSEFYPGSSESVGLVHVYKKNAAGKFIYIATMRPSTQLRSDSFGRAMVMNDTMMVIGTGNGAVSSSYRMRVVVTETLAFL